MGIDLVIRSIQIVRAAAARAVAWSLATVEDEVPHNVVPMPGPAHGPVPAIRIRLEEQEHRRAS